jgi:hypothetical protein
MTAKQQEKQHTDQDKQARQQLSDLIGNRVMHTLGQPVDFQRVQVRQLWQDRYRVNVLVGADAASVKVAHSYFLVIDSSGAILASTPAIKKAY